MRQGRGELLEFPVDRDAERLERAARGVGAPRTLPTALTTTPASWSVVAIGRRRTIAAAIRRDRRSSPSR